MGEVILDVAASVRDVRAASITLDGSVDDVWRSLRVALTSASAFREAGDDLAIASTVHVSGSWDRTLPIGGWPMVHPCDECDEATACTLRWDDGAGALAVVLTIRAGATGATATIEYSTGLIAGEGALPVLALLEQLGRTSTTAEQFRDELLWLDEV